MLDKNSMVVYNQVSPYCHSERGLPIKTVQQIIQEVEAGTKSNLDAMVAKCDTADRAVLAIMNGEYRFPLLILAQNPLVWGRRIMLRRAPVACGGDGLGGVSMFVLGMFMTRDLPAMVLSPDEAATVAPMGFINSLIVAGDVQRSFFNSTLDRMTRLRDADPHRVARVFFLTKSQPNQEVLLGRSDYISADWTGC